MTDYHVHTTFSDGKNTPEEMVLAAMGRGMTAIGFTDHSYTAFDESYCIPRGKTAEYRAAIRALQDQYAGKLRVLCGLEQDLYAAEPAAGFDYVIGSVHYMRFGEDYVPVDEGADLLRAAAERYCGGDLYRVAETYFATVARVAEQTGCDLIGHFDLIAKFNEDGSLFDESDPRYKNAAMEALDRLLAAKKPFEINTGAMSRGYRTTPYPARPWMEYIRARGGRLVLSGDSHSADTLCWEFDRFASLADEFEI